MIMLIRGLIISLCIFAVPAMAQESIFPQESRVTSTYTLSSANIEMGDTLVITRTIRNNETYPLKNLYLSENLPGSFHIANYTLKISWAPVPNLFTGPAEDEIIPGYFSYRWIVDLPDTNRQYDRLLGPGQVLELKYAIICDRPGSYLLPFHTFCAYGDDNGVFSVANPLVVNWLGGPCVYLPGDVNNDGYFNGFDAIYLVNYLKGGPPPPVICSCADFGYVMASADANGDCAVNGLDLLYIINYCKGGPTPSYCSDCPPERQ